MMTMGVIKGKEMAFQGPEIGIIQRVVNVLNID
jgi:hypothetical protein